MILLVRFLDLLRVAPFIEVCTFAHTPVKLIALVEPVDVYDPVRILASTGGSEWCAVFRVVATFDRPLCHRQSVSNPPYLFKQPLDENLWSYQRCQLQTRST